MTRAPYKFFDPYQFEDADLFFGRETEVQSVVGEILTSRLLVLFSPSGSGKTSLINAGVRPALEALGYRTVSVRLEADPISAIMEAVHLTLGLRLTPDKMDMDLYSLLKQSLLYKTNGEDLPREITGAESIVLVIFMDQFEEFFIVYRNQPALRQRFIQQLAHIKYDTDLPVFFVLSLREDYYVNLHEFRDAIPSIFQTNANIRLKPFTNEEAKRAIEEPAKAVGLGYENGLVESIITDLAQLNRVEPGVEPITLQIVCHTLWKKRAENDRKVTRKLYWDECGGAQQIIKNSVTEALQMVPKRMHRAMEALFRQLKTPDNTKRYRPMRELQQILKRTETRILPKLLLQLTDLDILRHEQRMAMDWYEFKHDYLISEINIWLKKQEIKRQAQRFRYNLAQTIILTILILALIVSGIFYFLTYEVILSERDYEAQKKEVEITRKFNPFNYRLQTGFLRSNLKEDYTVIDDIENGAFLSRWRITDWTALSSFLNQKSDWSLKQKLDIRWPETLTSALTDENASIRREAAQFITESGNADEEVVSALTRTLNDPQVGVRRPAAQALRRLAKSGGNVIESLTAALKNTDIHVRLIAADALGSLSEANDKVIAELTERLLLRDEDSEVKISIAYALKSLSNVDDKKVIDAFIEAFKVGTADVRVTVANVLGRLVVADEKAIDTLANALGDAGLEVKVRQAAADSLGGIGRANDKVIDALVSSLSSSMDRVRIAAADGLGQLGNADDRVIEALTEALKDGQPLVRSTAVRSLGRLAKADENVIATITKALVDPYREVRKAAAEGLGRLGEANDRTIAALSKTLSDADDGVRIAASEALGRIAKTDGSVILTLMKALKHKDSRTRYAAAHAMMRLTNADEKMIVELTNALGDEDPQVQVESAKALGVLAKADDKTVILKLTELLKRDDSMVRSAAANALGGIAKGGNKEVIKKVIEALIPLVKDDDSKVRTAAAEALGAIAENRDKKVIEMAIKVLIPVMKDDDSGVRTAAAKALGAIAENGDKEVIETAIKALIPALKDENERVRGIAADELGSLSRNKANDEITKYMTKRSSGERQFAALSFAERNKLSFVAREKNSSALEKKIAQLKENDSSPWVQIAVYDAHEEWKKHMEQLEKIQALQEQGHMRFKEERFADAQEKFEAAYRNLVEASQGDPTRLAELQFRSARCFAKLQSCINTLETLERAFELNSNLVGTLEEELLQPQNDWEIIKDNWYLKRVLLRER
jgi:HEAT repeat protein